MNGLPEPEVVRCSFVDGFPPRLPVLNLSWPESANVSKIRMWHFPGDMKFLSPLPERFGIQVLRHGVDSYCLVLSWDDLCLRWSTLTRAQILTGSVKPLLEALSTDISHLLDQPILADVEPLARSA
jgi:hypothetical protein